METKVSLDEGFKLTIKDLLKIIEYDEKIVIVTGGAGFVGSNLIQYLLKNTNYRILSLMIILQD